MKMGMAGMGLTALWLLAISVMDIRKRNVPVWLLAAGGILAAAACQQNAFLDMARAMLPGILLLATAFATKKAGCADGAAMLFLGLQAGSEKSFLIFAASMFLIAVLSLILLVLRKVRRDTRIPFLPFLAVGWLVIMVF